MINAQQGGHKRIKKWAKENRRKKYKLPEREKKKWSIRQIGCLPKELLESPTKTSDGNS